MTKMNGNAENKTQLTHCVLFEHVSLARGSSIKDIQSKGVWEGVNQCGWPRKDGGLAIGGMSTNTKFCISDAVLYFGCRIPPYPPVVRRAKYFAFEGIRAIRSGRPWTGGGGVFQTNDVGQGGGGFQKVTFWSDIFDGWPLVVMWDSIGARPSQGQWFKTFTKRVLRVIGFVSTTLNLYQLVICSLCYPCLVAGQGWSTNATFKVGGGITATKALYHIGMYAKNSHTSAIYPNLQIIAT